MRKYLVVFTLAIILSFAGSSAVSAAPGLQGGGTVHYVKSGETLFSIANQHGVSVEALMRFNGIANADLVYVGQPLRIPGDYRRTGAAPSPRWGCSNAHTVRAGETLSDIAYRYGVSIRELVRLNNLYNSNIVYAGQTICLPPQAGYAKPAHHSGPSPAHAHRHRVVAGETLHSIAQHYGINHWDIVRANNLGNASLIIIGEAIIIPGYHPPVAHPKPVHHYEKPGPKELTPPKAPPPAPYYEDYDDSPKYHSKKKPHGDGGPKPYDGGVPPAPDYQPVSKSPLLPLADHPIEVVINGGVNWVGESFSYPDPAEITTLVVQTGGEYGVNVRIRSGDYEVEGMSDVVNLGQFGPHTFVFQHIPPGDYDVWIDDPDRPSEKVSVDIDPGQRVEVTFEKGLSYSGPTFASPKGWYISSWDNPSVPRENIGGWSNILVQTPASGLNVLIESEGGGYQAKCFTGSKGPGACDFAGLQAGFYYITIDGTDLTLKTYMDGNAYATFEFARQPGSGDDENVIGPVDYP